MNRRLRLAVESVGGGLLYQVVMRSWRCLVVGHSNVHGSMHDTACKPPIVVSRRYGTEGRFPRWSPVGERVAGTCSVPAGWRAEAAVCCDHSRLESMCELELYVGLGCGKRRGATEEDIALRASQIANRVHDMLARISFTLCSTNLGPGQVESGHFTGTHGGEFE